MCDFWLWSYLKSKIYLIGGHKPKYLKDNKALTARNVPCEILRSAVENVMRRMLGEVQEIGGHIECCPNHRRVSEYVEKSVTFLVAVFKHVLSLYSISYLTMFIAIQIIRTNYRCL